MIGDPLTLTPQLFAIFSGLIEEAAGLHYGPNDRELFASKLVAHAADLGFDSLLDYYYRLRYDDPAGTELAQLVEVLLVHETYFFRELEPLVQLADGHLADAVARRGNARVWSAACSTGEEPFTLAMLLDARGLLGRVELIGSDLSAQVIASAASGVHKKRALRDHHPAELAARYLEPCPDGVAVAPQIRSAVAFRTVNLLDAAQVRALGAFDAILCRNVLIYFCDDQVTRVIDQLAGSLTADGLLAVGVSESLLRFGTSLVCEERGRSFFYRRAR
jgi:chemotaxis protein methyltransferase CheR